VPRSREGKGMKGFRRVFLMAILLVMLLLSLRSASALDVLMFTVSKPSGEKILMVCYDNNQQDPKDDCPNGKRYQVKVH
jgi:hypothetical protein